MNLFNKLEQGYESLWKMIIRPPRAKYPDNQLGPQAFLLQSTQVKRVDFTLTNPRGSVFFCSHFIPLNLPTYPCLIYLHRNSSNRTQGIEYLPELIKQGISLLTFDFAGCGNSEGEYISLGWFQWQDLAEVVKYLRGKQQVTEIGVWGRSMGAVTALMYLKKDPKIKAAVFDSPFKSLASLIEDLCKKNSKIPMFILAGAVKIISKTIEDRAKFDIYKLNPLKTQVPYINTPGFFITSKQDDIINPKHTEEIYKIYPGPKHLVACAGDHNSKRPDKYIKQIIRFLKKHLVPKTKEKFVEQQVQVPEDKETVDFFSELGHKEAEKPGSTEQKVDFFADPAGVDLTSTVAVDPQTSMSALASLGTFLNKINPFSHQDKKTPQKDKAAPQTKIPTDSYNDLREEIAKTFQPEKSRQTFKFQEQKQAKQKKLQAAPTDNTFMSQLSANIDSWSFK